MYRACVGDAAARPGKIKLRPNVPDIPYVTKRARSDLAGYYAAIEQLDDNIGRLRAKLDELTLAQNTYLVFFSDHGDLHGSHGHWHKTMPWEESIRIPFIVGGPSREVRNATRCEVPINHVDIAPTSLGLCGIPVPQTMEGTDYSGLVTGLGGLSDSADYPIPPISACLCQLATRKASTGRGVASSLATTGSTCVLKDNHGCCST